MKDKTKILFFTPEFRISEDNVYRSQILGQANALQKNGFECYLVASDIDEKNCAKAQTEDKVLKLSSASVFLYNSKRKSWWKNIYHIMKVAIKSLPILRKWNPDVIYVREFISFYPALLLSRYLGVEVIYDARGNVAAEAVLKQKSYLRSSVIKYLELKSVKNADRLLCVSKHYKDWLETQTGRRDIFVIPSCIDTSEFKFKPDARKRIRNSLQCTEDTPIITYCGGHGVWQRIEDILDLMALCQMIEPKVKCIMLTSDPQKIKKIIVNKSFNSSNFYNLCVPHKSVPDWLSASDIGIILRHNILVNNVASPVKIAEYLACGLRIICSDGIGDLSSFIGNKKLGLVLDSGNLNRDSEIETLLRNVPLNLEEKNRVLDIAGQYLSWQAHIPTYRRVYCKKCSFK